MGLSYELVLTSLILLLYKVINTNDNQAIITNILMAQIIFELLINEPDKELTFVNIIRPPTPIASTLTGNDFTNQAEIGAAITPPMLKDITNSQFIDDQSKNIKNPNEDTTVTKNSLAETVPITYRGSTFLLDNKSGVFTGPQPPPPIESSNPAIIAWGTNTNLDIFFTP